MQGSPLTIETIRAAQSNDLDAVTAVIRATEDRIAQLASRAAQRMAPSGDRYAEYLDEFKQVGRIAAWEALERFNKGTVDEFHAFIWSTVTSKLKDAVREARHGAAGADKDAIKVFGRMLVLAHGDPYLAEKLAQTVPPKGVRLGPERAYAARLAWQGWESIDLPPGPDPERPNKGEATRYVIETVATELGIPEDVLMNDLVSEVQRDRSAVVRAILEAMGEKQRTVLKFSFGIGVECYGYGRDNQDDELAKRLNCTVANVRSTRHKGLKAFAKRYIKVAARSEAEAAELEAAAKENLSRAA